MYRAFRWSKIMALRELNILNDCIEAISNQSLILDINNKAFLDDIQTEVDQEI